MFCYYSNKKKVGLSFQLVVKFALNRKEQKKFGVGFWRVLGGFTTENWVTPKNPPVLWISAWVFQSC